MTLSMNDEWGDSSGEEGAADVSSIQNTSTLTETQ